jgi:NADH:ubiquinone oxidoreductase subunit C
MMALHGMAFARHGDEWRIVMSDESAKGPALKDFLVSKANESRSDAKRQDAL